MCKYKKGDVVWALCPFTDGTGTKHRPCIVLNLDKDCRYFIVECSSLKGKHHNLPGIIVRSNHDEFANLGFPESTFINFSNKAWLKETFLRPPPGEKENPIGVCNFMEKIVKPD